MVNQVVTEFQLNFNITSLSPFLESAPHVVEGHFELSYGIQCAEAIAQVGHFHFRAYASVLLMSFSRLLSKEMVDVFVGPERKQFHLHKDLLCDRSSYFQKAFEGDFKESRENSMDLAEDEVAAFELFVDWLYSGRLTEVPNDEGNGWPYIHLYILATKFTLESLANTTMDRLQEYFAAARRFPNGQQINHIWDNTPCKSKLRDYYTRKIAIGFLESQVFDEKGFLECKEEAVLAVMAHFRKAWVTKQLPSIPSVPACMFHEHTTTEKCESQGSNHLGFQGATRLASKHTPLGWF